MTHKTRELRVAISGFHNGQIVTPVVRVWSRGNNSVNVELYWDDASQTREQRARTADEPLRFRGSSTKAEYWLREQGVHLDGQGIH